MNNCSSQPSPPLHSFLYLVIISLLSRFHSSARELIFLNFTPHLVFYTTLHPTRPSLDPPYCSHPLSTPSPISRFHPSQHLIRPQKNNAPTPTPATSPFTRLHPSCPSPPKKKPPSPQPQRSYSTKVHNLRAELNVDHQHSNPVLSQQTLPPEQTQLAD